MCSPLLIREIQTLVLHKTLSLVPYIFSNFTIKEVLLEVDNLTVNEHALLISQIFYFIGELVKHYITANN